MKDELGGKTMNKFVGLRSKTCSYLIDDGSKDKKSKNHKKLCHKKNTQILKLENYKSYLEATQLENKINHIEKDKTDTDTIKENHKEFIKSNKSIIKLQQRFKSQRFSR